MTEVAASRPGVKRIIGIDYDFGALWTAGPRYWGFVTVLSILTGLGIVTWIVFLTHGGGVMAQRDEFTLGLWFSNYMYYVGLSAGGLVVYASVHLFGAHQFHPVGRLAVLQAGVLVMVALLGDLTDFVRPWRFFWFVVTPNPTAIFVYTGSAAAIYMVICFVDLWVLITGKGEPTLFPRQISEYLELLGEYRFPFIELQTNGIRLAEAAESDGWVARASR